MIPGGAAEARGWELDVEMLPGDARMGATCPRGSRPLTMRMTATAPARQDGVALKQDVGREVYFGRNGRP